MGELDKPLLEKCGIVGVYARTYAPRTAIAIKAASGVQHRGQHGAGFAYLTEKGLHTYKRDGLIKNIFTPSVVRDLNLPQRWSLVHTRYGTSGDYSATNIQPCIITADDGSYVSVVHNGEFPAVEQMKQDSGIAFAEGASDTYIFARRLGQITGSNWATHIKQVLSTTTGAYSLMITVGQELFAARDIHGIRPLFLGTVGDAWILASETHAFDKVGASFVREIGCGEILHFTPERVSTIQKKTDAKRHFCDFEWAYFARPNSRFSRQMNGKPEEDEENLLSVYAFREQCGQIMAQEAPIPNADVVIGIPDSGLAFASGYAQKLQVPHQHLIIRDHFDTEGSSRLFMRDDDKQGIGSKVLGKLSMIPDRYLWEGKTVVLCDDSVVRGNVSAQITKAVFGFGAKAVHWVIGFPPVRHRCHLGVSIRTHDELIAVQTNGDTKEIARQIGATSVTYISYKGFIRARLPKGTKLKNAPPEDIFLANGGCGGCLTGKYPVSKSGRPYGGEDD